MKSNRTPIQSIPVQPFHEMCFIVSKRLWLQAAINSMDLSRIQTFQKLANKTIRIGSDCSGGDAAFHAAKEWVPGLAENWMMSEAPNANGPILFGLLNNPPKKFFKDLLGRGFSGYCIMSGGRTPVPRDLDHYSAGTVCTDFCNYNHSNPKQFPAPPLFQTNSKPFQTFPNHSKCSKHFQTISKQFQTISKPF